MPDTQPILTARDEPAAVAMDRQRMRAFVSGLLDRRDVFLRAAGRHGSPLYVIEPDVLRRRARRFTEAFSRESGEVDLYYAVKSNNHPEIARTLVEAGLGLDVSSGLELQMALECGATEIVFSGPGKTDAELALAVEHRDRTTVLIDSFGELERLGRIAEARSARIRAGVRLTTNPNGLWRKLGIPLEALGDFFDAADAWSGIELRGLQFHTSWNLDPRPQVDFIVRLGEALERLPAGRRAAIEFIDIGGGFWVEQGEWLQSDGSGEPCDSPAADRHYWRPAAAIEQFAERIAQAFGRHLQSRAPCRLCAEPGRWLCHAAAHLLLTVVDVKARDLVITDGGTNAVGWERFETDYFPVINLSSPELTERPCHILGSLCTPHDVWGYGYWGRSMKRGDLLLVPTQGAYTYSLRQEFIKPLPAVVMLQDDIVA